VLAGRALQRTEAANAARAQPARFALPNRAGREGKRPEAAPVTPQACLRHD